MRVARTVQRHLRELVDLAVLIDCGSKRVGLGRRLRTKYVMKTAMLPSRVPWREDEPR